MLCHINKAPASPPSVTAVDNTWLCCPTQEDLREATVGHRHRHMTSAVVSHKIPIVQSSPSLSRPRLGDDMI